MIGSTLLATTIAFRGATLIDGTGAPAVPNSLLVVSDGRIVSGIITDQNAETITVVSNPEKPQPQTIARDDVDEMAKASASLMPKGLLDRFSRDEVLELMSYLESPPK